MVPNFWRWPRNASFSNYTTSTIQYKFWDAERRQISLSQQHYKVYAIIEIESFYPQSNKYKISIYGITIRRYVLYDYVFNLWITKKTVPKRYGLIKYINLSYATTGCCETFLYVKTVQIFLLAKRAWESDWHNFE